MRRIDYYIKYNPELDNNLTVFMKILYATILKRIKFKKPTITHISGKSGEGKSLTVLYIMYLLLKMQNLDVKEYLEDVNIHTQREYTQKISSLIKDPRLKKVNVLAVHEGREAMEANEWRTTFNRNVAHVNALSRAIKRMAIFIVSQGIKDITKDVRRTLDYQIKINRPLRKGAEGNARLLWYAIYEDDRDIENPVLRKRRIRGMLIMPNGRYIPHNPSYISIPKVEKELQDLFDAKDVQSKWEILKEKLEDMEKDQKQKQEDKESKIRDLAEFYTNNDAARIKIAKINKRGNYKVTNEFKKIHDLKPSEINQFEELLKKSLEDKNAEQEFTEL